MDTTAKIADRYASSANRRDLEFYIMRHTNSAVDDAIDRAATMAQEHQCVGSTCPCSTLIAKDIRSLNGN